MLKGKISKLSYPGTILINNSVENYRTEMRPWYRVLDGEILVIYSLTVRYSNPSYSDFTDSLCA